MFGYWVWFCLFIYIWGIFLIFYTPISQNGQTRSNNWLENCQGIVWVCLTILWDWRLTLFRMGFFGAAHGWGGTKRASLPKICHTYPTTIKLGTAIPYRKKIQKLYESHDRPLEFCWCQHFFTGNHQILLYQEIQIQIAFWYIISIYFNISWVFIDCYNKRD